MDTRLFREEIVDKEIKKIVDNLKNDEFIKKSKTTENKESYAFLYWFIERYYPNYPKNELKKFIVEGSDDASCDIIFSNKDRANEKTTYYVIQAKWFTSKKVLKSNKTSSLLKSSISDFQTILNGDKLHSPINDRFNEKYEELQEHISKNGKVVFIFLALCEKPDNGIKENITSFTKDYGNLVDLKIYDINKLKRDYIELEFKEIKTHNPLETPYEPINNIELDIDVKNHIEINSPDLSYIFLIKPSVIYNLFDKYGHSIFYRNIRNPLHKSAFNENISMTLREKPTRFWYYNNGITAITSKIEDFNKKSGSKITVKGIQIINGAQTVYSIYRAFKELDFSKKEYTDDRVLITLRLITSSDDTEDTLITKYTNSQNPVTPRDFHSNDKVQKEIQKLLFEKTNIWYETRRGEFRKRLPKSLGIKIVSNEKLGQTFLSYNKKQPILAKASRTDIFKTSQESNKGLYEHIFDSAVNEYKDLMISYYLYEFVEYERKENYKRIKKIEDEIEFEDYTEIEEEIINYKFLQYTSFNFLAAFNFTFSKIGLKQNELNNKIIYDLSNDFTVIKKHYLYIKKKAFELVKKKEESNRFTPLKYFRSESNSVTELEEVLKEGLSENKIKELSF